jgi:hypothetical protein
LQIKYTKKVKIFDICENEARAVVWVKKTKNLSNTFSYVIESNLNFLETIYYSNLNLNENKLIIKIDEHNTCNGCANAGIPKYTIVIPNIISASTKKAFIAALTFKNIMA